MRRKKQLRILVADTDELSLALIRTYLETENYLVCSALNCDQAISLAAKGSFDLVISDQQMQTSAGVALSVLIGRVPDNRSVPFLFTSSTQRPDVISRRFHDRNVFFIRKPFEHEAFLELVQFAMWSPGHTRMHIEKMHRRQGLKAPCVRGEAPVSFPVISVGSMRSGAFPSPESLRQT